MLLPDMGRRRGSDSASLADSLRNKNPASQVHTAQCLPETLAKTVFAIRIGDCGKVFSSLEPFFPLRRASARRFFEKNPLDKQGRSSTIGTGFRAISESSRKCRSTTPIPGKTAQDEQALVGCGAARALHVKRSSEHPGVGSGIRIFFKILRDSY